MKKFLSSKLKEAIFVWTHLSIVIILGSLIFAFLMTIGCNETISFTITTILVTLGIIVPIIYKHLYK